MTMCNVKWVVWGVEPPENYQSTLLFPSALWSSIASFSSLFWFLMGCNIFVSLVHSYHCQTALETNFTLPAQHQMTD